MTLINQWMDSEWLQALGWTFIHSLWQITLIGLVLYAVLRIVPNAKAHLRYTLSSLALWMIVITSLSTFILMLPVPQETIEVSGQVFFIPVQETGESGSFRLWLEARMPMLLTVWLGGVAILMLRLAFSLGSMWHLRVTAESDPDMLSALQPILNRMNIKSRPIAATSRWINSPVTIGHIKPMILFPVGLINQLTPSEVEAVLTHELAHIVRRDYLSNVIQSFIETIFYYHPVTWWISKTVRTERENRADDLAIKWCGDELGYAKALMTVQEMQLKQTPALAIGFASKKDVMLNRIRRILQMPHKNHNQMEKTVLLSLCTICFFAFTFAHQQPEEADVQLDVTKELFYPKMVEVVDSIPAKGIYKIHKKTDDQDIEVEVENGEIKSLEIDGKSIQKEEYEAYQSIIDELMGSMVTPPMPERFEFEMPPLPDIPPLPDMEEFFYSFDFEMPELPELPEIPELHFEHLFSPEFQLDGNGLMDFRMEWDSTPDGQTKIIIIQNGDSSVIVSDYGFFQGGNGLNYFQLDPEMKGEWNKEQAEHWRQYADEWRKQSEQYREQWREQAEQWRRDADRHREDQTRQRQELREHLRHRDDERRILELELREGHPSPRAYALRSPSLNLSDQMVKDGLIAPGEEADVLLTPDKLRINGKKMTDALHQKYLRMYEQQQGIELTGNSRVEFKTKTKKRF